jgi:hypothetical protein
MDKTAFLHDFEQQLTVKHLTIVSAMNMHEQKTHNQYRNTSYINPFVTCAVQILYCANFGQYKIV